MDKFFLSFKSFFILFSIFVATGCNAKTEDCLASRSLSDTELIGVLSNDNFSGVLDANTSLKYFGGYKSGDRELGVYVYQREFGNHRLTQRLLFVLNGKHYLGMYEIPEPPVSMEGFNVVFPFSSEHGNTISLQTGELPTEVLLDGELMEFFK